VGALGTTFISKIRMSFCTLSSADEKYRDTFEQGKNYMNYEHHGAGVMFYI